MTRIFLPQFERASEEARSVIAKRKIRARRRASACACAMSLMLTTFTIGTTLLTFALSVQLIGPNEIGVSLNDSSDILHSGYHFRSPWTEIRKIFIGNGTLSYSNFTGITSDKREVTVRNISVDYEVCNSTVYANRVIENRNLTSDYAKIIRTFVKNESLVMLTIYDDEFLTKYFTVKFSSVIDWGINVIAIKFSKFVYTGDE